MTKRDQQVIINAVLSALEGSKKADKPAVSKAPVDRKSAYETAVLKGMKRKLGATADIQLRVNVLPYKAWLEQGRVVRKGEHGVRGLFHVSQTNVLIAHESNIVAQVSA